MQTLFICLSLAFVSCLGKEKRPLAPEIRVRPLGHVKTVLSPNRHPLPVQTAAAVTEDGSELSLSFGGANGNPEPTAGDPRVDLSSSSGWKTFVIESDPWASGQRAPWAMLKALTNGQGDRVVRG